MENKKAGNREKAMRGWKLGFAIPYQVIGEVLMGKVIRSKASSHAHIWGIVQDMERASGKTLKLEGAWSGVSTGDSLWVVRRWPWDRRDSLYCGMQALFTSQRDTSLWHSGFRFCEVAKGGSRCQQGTYCWMQARQSRCTELLVVFG